jgi:DNA-directed RNA polymerase subunit RPC12/RpoP
MIIIKCKKCGYVLYRTATVIPVSAILRQYGYKCPRCGAQLNLDPQQWRWRVE